MQVWARRVRWRALVGLATVVLGACGSETSSPPTPPAADVAFPSSGDRIGTARLVGTAPPPSEGTSSIVILYPHEPVDVPVPTEPAEMDQFGRDFIPRILLVRQGQAVLFKNSEDDLHTVHVSDADGNSLFNVAMPIRGGRHDHTFTDLGEYAIACDAHPEMAATIFVLDTPYYAVADRDGAFGVDDLAVGTYDVVLQRGPERHEQVVEITPGLNELVLAFPTGS